MSYKIADSVWHRVVQIVQEAMITGVDCADLMRQVRVQVDSNDETTLVLTTEYEAQVLNMHKKYLEEIESLKTQVETAENQKLILEN
jgi:hypothetical protein